MPTSNPAASEGHVLVIGAAGIDVKGRTDSVAQPGMILPGQIRFRLGGVARNSAENRARVEVPTVLLTNVGDDSNGQIVQEKCRAAGINMSQVLVLPGQSTGSYLRVANGYDDPGLGVFDYSIIEQITPEVLHRQTALFEEASLVVIDANLSPQAIDTVFRLAEAYSVPVCADPTSAALASKLCDYLPRLYMIDPNSAETTALCGISVPAHDAETAIRAARHLVALGVKIAIVTLADQGLAYADSASSGHIPAIHTHIEDTTGAGDALTAGVIFGLLNGVPLDEAMRLGVSAATLTLRSREAVVPELTQELLYDELVI